MKQIGNTTLEALREMSEKIYGNMVRLREILRARDEFLRLFYDGSTDFEAIERYFHYFALAARRGRG
jgi:hypothetical protein